MGESESEHLKAQSTASATKSELRGVPGAVPATKSALRGSSSAVPATKSALGGSQSAAPATKSALRGSPSAAPATKFALRGSPSDVPATKPALPGPPSAVPATKSALRASQSAAPATKSALRGSQGAVPVTKSALQGSPSAAPATKSARRGSPSATLARFPLRLPRKVAAAYENVHGAATRAQSLEAPAADTQIQRACAVEVRMDDVEGHECTVNSNELAVHGRAPQRSKHQLPFPYRKNPSVCPHCLGKKPFWGSLGKEGAQQTTIKGPDNPTYESLRILGFQSTKQSESQ